MSPSLPGFTIAPCVDSLLCYRSILQDSPKISDTCIHLYNCIWVVLLVSRLNLAFISPKLSRGIDILLVYLCPCGFDNPRNTLMWKLLQLASVRLRIILFGLRTANNMIVLLLPYGFNTLEYSWVKATIGICTLADYSMAMKCQQAFWRHCQGSQLILSICRVNRIQLVNTISLSKIIFCSVLFVVLTEMC
jgi:hypothetical protein